MRRTPAHDPVRLDRLGQGARSLVLPEFFMPFPERRPNPAHRRAEAGMWRWIGETGLCPTEPARANTERTMPALLMALYYPRAGAGILELLAQWTAWAFIVDDEFDDGAAGRDPATVLAAITSLVDVMDGAPPANPLAEALAGLWQRLTARCPAAWGRVFRRDVVAWLNTYYVEAVDRIAAPVPSGADFVLHRRESVGIRTFLDGCEPALGLHPPDAVRLLPAFAAARRAACDHVGLINDIFSV
ncbi:terpene synthase family protein, partial [Nonomuraea sp. NPDC004297]